MNKLLVSFAAVLAFSVGAALALILSPAKLDSAPVRWVHDTYPQGIQVCPGDKVPYVLGIWHNRDEVIRFTSSVDRAMSHPVTVQWRESEIGQTLSSQYNAEIVGDTVIVGPSPVSMVIKGTGTTNIRIDPDGTFTVPDLEEGPYVRNIAVWMEGRDAQVAIWQQKFTVREDCGGD